MNNLIKTTIICLLGFMPFLTKAVQKENVEKPSVKIEIIVKDSALLKDAKILFEISQDGMNSPYLTSKTYTHEITGSRTKLTIPLSTTFNYGRVNHKYKKVLKNGALLSSGEVCTFIFENGDDLTMVMTKEGFSFKGKGSGKYNYINLVNTRTTGPIKSNNKTTALYNRGDYEGWIYARKEQIDSLFVILADSLKKYKPFVSPQVYRQIEVDNWAMYNRRVLGLLTSRNFNHPDSNYNKAHGKVFEKIFADFDAHRFDDDAALAQSYYYADYLMLKAGWTAAFVLNNPWVGTKKKPKFGDIYPILKKSATGLVRDKLMLVAFKGHVTRRSDTNDFIQDAIKSMGNNKYRENLEGFVTTLQDPFPFELPDAAGKIHKLSDFKGKVIVLDFWFTGCTPCKFLAVAMKPIVRSYKDNPNVVFITVSVDGIKFKDLWLKSLKDETYSSKDGINLLAIDGKESEIIKYHNIRGYPTIFIISKEGKMITTSPPRPSVGNAERNAAFKALIDKHL